MHLSEVRVHGIAILEYLEYIVFRKLNRVHP